MNEQIARMPDARPVFLFDIEGTLVDSAQQQLTSWQDALRGAGCDVSHDALQRVSGMDGNDLIKTIAPHLSEEQRKAVLETQGKDFETRFLPKVDVFPGMRETLRFLHERGARLALATDCKGKVLTHYRQLIGLDNLFEIVVSGEDVTEGKPNPRLVKEALRRLNVKSETEAHMVGDTPSDAHAARGAGIAAIGLLSGGCSEADLRDAGCSVVLDQVSDLELWYHARPQPRCR